MTSITLSKSTCVCFYTSIIHTVPRLRPFSVHAAGRTQSSGSPTPWCHTYTTTQHCVWLDYHGCSTHMLTGRWQVSCWETVLEQDCWSYLTHTRRAGLQNRKWICFWPGQSLQDTQARIFGTEATMFRRIDFNMKLTKQVVFHFRCSSQV